jgi:hypothetical protein
LSGQVGRTISHYAPKAHPPLADKMLEKLGEGEMGIVYKAENLKLNCFNFYE